MNPEENSIVCPDCSTVVEKPSEMTVGDIVECQECGTELEILSLEPLKYQELVEEK